MEARYDVISLLSDTFDSDNAVHFDSNWRREE
jgi:hypothetical protein